MQELIFNVKLKVHPWIRLNRVIRDIPNQYIMGGNEVTNLRQHILARMKRLGVACRCIRCREVRKRQVRREDSELVERTYQSSGGTEHFLSYETRDRKIIFGFCRLRLSEGAGLEGALPELKGAALVRELHVYGKVKVVGDRNVKPGDSQHAGFGSRLMGRAEEIARNNGYKKVAVIAGIGTRRYYANLGYRLEVCFVVLLCCFRLFLFAADSALATGHLHGQGHRRVAMELVLGGRGGVVCRCRSLRSPCLDLTSRKGCSTFYTPLLTAKIYLRGWK